MTCAYCGTISKEERCPSCGAPRRKGDDLAYRRAIEREMRELEKAFMRMVQRGI